MDGGGGFASGMGIVACTEPLHQAAQGASPLSLALIVRLGNEAQRDSFGQRAGSGPWDGGESGDVEKETTLA